MSPRILIIPGSSRKASFNAQLGDALAAAISKRGAVGRAISLNDYAMPLYNGDPEAEQGVPASAVSLGGLIEEHDGVILVCPEYNGSITPLLKNTLTG